MEHGAIDLHTKESQIRIVTSEGRVVLDQRMATRRDRFTRLFGERPAMRILLETRTQLVGMRRQVISVMRAHLRADGLRLRTGAAESFMARYRQLDIPAALQEVFTPLLALLDTRCETRHVVSGAGAAGVEFGRSALSRRHHESRPGAHAHALAASRVDRLAHAIKPSVGVRARFGVLAARESRHGDRAVPLGSYAAPAMKLRHQERG